MDSGKWESLTSPSPAFLIDRRIWCQGTVVELRGRSNRGSGFQGSNPMTFCGLKLKALRIAYNSEICPWQLWSHLLRIPPPTPLRTLSATLTTLWYMDYSRYLPTSKLLCWLFTRLRFSYPMCPHGSLLNLFQDFSQRPPFQRGYQANHPFKVVMSHPPPILSLSHMSTNLSLLYSTSPVTYMTLSYLYIYLSPMI